MQRNQKHDSLLIKKVKWYSTKENSMVLKKNTKILQLPHDPTILFLGYVPKELRSVSFQVWKHMSIITAFGRMHKNASKFQFSLNIIARMCLQIITWQWPRRIKIRILLGGVSQTCNPSIWETDEETQILVQPGQDSENLFKKTKSQMILEPQTRVSQKHSV